MKTMVERYKYHPFLIIVIFIANISHKSVEANGKWIWFLYTFYWLANNVKHFHSILVYQFLMPLLLLDNFRAKLFQITPICIVLHVFSLLRLISKEFYFHCNTLRNRYPFNCGSKTVFFKLKFIEPKLQTLDSGLLLMCRLSSLLNQLISDQMLCFCVRKMKNSGQKLQTFDK